MEGDRQLPTKRHFRAGLVLDDRYRLVKPLADGGMGTVWVAEQLGLSRLVAVKSLYQVEPHNKARLRAEALSLAAVHHPAVVQIFDFQETSWGLPYLAMELVVGPTLAQLLERKGPMSAREAVRTLRPLLDGLRAAHAAGVVHRDVKPDNVVMTSLGSEGPMQAKLIDFGIAKSLIPTDLRLTDSGSIVGTPSYMAPEQVRGGNVDTRTDVWGAAALLYHACNGAPPFDGQNAYETMERVVHSPPRYPRAARGLNGALWSILNRALQKEADARTASVEQLGRELDAWLARRTQSGERERAAGESAPLPSEPAVTLDAPSSLDSLIQKKMRY